MMRRLFSKRTTVVFLILTLLLSTAANAFAVLREPDQVHAESVADIINAHTQSKVNVTVDGVQYAIVTLDCYINPENLSVSTPTYTPVKVYVDADGNPVADEDIVLKIRMIDKARYIQEAKVAYTVKDMPSLLEERFQQHGFIRLGEALSGALSTSLAIAIRAYITQGKSIPEDVVGAAKKTVFQLVVDPKNLIASIVYMDFHDATNEFNEFLVIDRAGTITDYQTAYNYLHHLCMAWALVGPSMNVLGKIDDINRTLGDEFANWGARALIKIVDAWYDTSGFLNGLLYVAESLNGITLFNEFKDERRISVESVETQLQQTLGTHGEYTLNLASHSASQTLIPDLTVTSVGCNPYSTETDSSISVTFTIKNQGDVSSGSFVNRVFLSVPPYKWHTDIALGTFYMDSLEPGSSRSSTVSVPIPADTPAGSYYVTVYTDAFREIEEKEDFGLISPNNIGSTSPQMLTVTTPAKIDLAVESVIIPQSAGLGETIPVSFTVRNLESTASGEFTNRVFLSTSSTNNEIALGEFDMPFLAGGASNTTTVDVVIPQVLPANEYYINVFADGLYSIGETNENNNIASSPKKLAIKAEPSPAIASNPDQITYSAIQGGYNPPSKTLNIWNSADGDFSWSISDDASWLTTFPSSGTYTGSIGSVSVSADITGMIPGNYYATINISSAEAGSKLVPVSLSINEPSYPNLYISDVLSFNDNPYTGEQITVGATVRNNGNFQSGATKVKYYFSTYGGGRDIYLGENLIDQINVDSSTTVYQSVTMPDHPYERAYIVAVVNPDNNIVEETYNDNLNNHQLAVQPVDNEAPQIGEFALRWGLGVNQDEFKTGHEYSIVFHITDDIAVDTLDFQYSYDNGVTWSTIVSDFVIGSNGFSNGYHWTVPEDAPLVETLRIKVIARDTSGKESVRVTDPLKIIDGAAPKIEILSPKGGEVWDLGSTHEITWNASASSGIVKVRIYVYFADTSEYISTELVNDGAYSWTLPVASGLVTDTGRIKIRVEDNNSNEAESWSNGYFSISDPSLPPPAPWSMPEVVTSVPSGGLSSKGNGNPQIAVDSDGTVHMIYKYSEDSGIVTPPRLITQEIKYITFDGLEWSAPETVYSIEQETDANLTNYHSILLSGIILDDDGIPHIVWEENVGNGLVSYNSNEVYYCYRDNGVWSEPENISNNLNVSSNPIIDIDVLGNIHIIWLDGYSFNADWSRNGTPNLYHKIKYSASSVFSPTSQITQEGAGWPSVASDDSGHLHLVYKWENVHYMTWDSSIGWSSATVVIPGIGHYQLDIVCDTTNNLHLAWYNQSGSNPQKILYSSYNGSSWSTPQEISEVIPSHSPIFPSVSVDSSGWPHIVYEDSADSSVQYKRKSQVGWSEGIKLSLESQYVSQASSDMAISDDDHLYVVWVNQYDGHSEIFFTHADMSQDTISPVANITAPTLGEQLSINTSYTINWSATDNIGVNSISLDYVINGSTNDSVSIVTGIGNSGSYQWAVPNISSDKVQIRITAYDLNGNAGTYFSDYFSISDTTRPSVSVLTPNGGEEWVAGSQQNIEWEASDNVGVSTIDLLVSVDNGSNWDLIISGLENSGSYLWNVPETVSSDCILKAIAIDAENNQGEDVSDSGFSIISSNNPPDIPGNPAPGNESTNISTNANLSWNCTDPDSGDSITYDVYFGNTTEFQLVATSQTQPEFNLSTLDYQTSYLWKVVATDSNGTSTSGPTWTFLTELEPIPLPPTDLHITGASFNQTTLEWVDNSSNELGFKIERRIGTNDSYTQLCTVEANETLFSDTDLVEGTPYYYRICSYSGSGNSSYSNEVNTTTLMQPVASFSMSSEGILIGQVGYAIVFNASSSSDPDGTIASYEWDFGDGNISSGTIVTHLYWNTGNYIANLTVTDDDDLTDTYSEDLTIVHIGDANSDGVVNASDIIAEERIIFGLDFDTPGADPNCDGKVSPSDITVIEGIIDSPLMAGNTLYTTYRTGAVAYGTSDTTVIVDAPTQVPEDSSFTAQVVIENASDFDTSTFEVTFDNSVLWLKNVSSGNISGVSVPVDIWSEITAGTVRVVQNINGTSGVSGEGYIAELHFDVVGSAGNGSPIHISNCALGDAGAQEISTILIDAGVLIVKLGDLTGDSHVNVLDMIRIGQRWGQTGAPGWIYEDIRPDGVINVLDMILIGQHWTG